MSSPLQPHIAPDSFFHTIPSPSPAASTDPPAPPTIIYFISGNPGLISYYYPFFTLLSEKLTPLLTNTTTNEPIHIHGHSLAGFEVSPSAEAPHYHDLEDQIRFVQNRLDTFITQITPQNATPNNSNSNSKPKVILMGHSVGTYIAMEILRRHRERTAAATTQDSQHPTIEFDIVGGVMLFPTVVDIAHSPAGRKLTTLLKFIPHLALLVALLARTLTTLLPAVVLRSVVSAVTGNPPPHAVDTTCAFLKSRMGVRQALHMAADEMRTITSDKWANNIWGVSSADEPALTKMVFYFGRNDHWVAEQTREEIIRVRGGEKDTEDGNGDGDGPTMLVCEDGVPHAFCLRHSEVTARKVAGMVMDIVRG
ncbi:hypothetical protein BO71DRAFT_382063 [Aspergillus ellipticus CBS 707.79]|uniref:Lipid droplet-associated hydrolase n=1 Tax=Aspergillus ellipticus CBS 707.79 TaxID=1448320 RepID=A0A319EQH0_9EURO|nr:hypothetical protein BO71DRAFT_382063 [Aspergillus ellipticus CBS 707.79]